MKFTVAEWFSDDINLLGEHLSELVSLSDSAIPDDPATLIQIGVLAPGLGDFMEKWTHLFAHAVNSQEKCK